MWHIIESMNQFPDSTQDNLSQPRLHIWAIDSRSETMMHVLVMHKIQNTLAPLFYNPLF